MQRSISYSTYCDKIYAGWMGKSIGGTLGAPLECHTTRLDISRENIWPDTIYPNDDLDIQVVWLEALEERGVWLTHRDLVEMWQDRCAYNFCEYGFFLHNVQRGIMPPLSGWWNNRFFRESEGCPIRSEIWGMVAPGNPALAAEYAKMDGELDHADASVLCEMFLAGAAAEAFFATDIRRILHAGLTVTPPDNPVREMVAFVENVCAQYPRWEDAWRLIIRRYGDRDSSKALVNQAIAVMALLLGEGDFSKTMVIAVNSGFDADCTAATAGALLGLTFGSSCLPNDWVERMGKSLACAIAVRHKTAGFDSITEDTARIGLEMTALRNPNVIITDAPTVSLRPRPAPAVTLAVQYLEQPVLWSHRTTPIELCVHNPTDHEVQGSWSVEIPVGIDCTPREGTLTIPPNATASVVVEVNFHGEILWDRNLLILHWAGHDGVRTECLFGLGGARQWTVYGPYWDMWDTTKHEICPYCNDTVKAHPYTVGLTADAWMNYVRLDKPYLNEERLAHEELPEELPFVVEIGEDDLVGSQLCGFRGQACFYVVRQLAATDPQVVELNVSSSAPYVIWWDGKEVFRREEGREWSPHDTRVSIVVGPQPKRLVVKLTRQNDHLAFGLFPGKADWGSDSPRGVAVNLDTLGDVPARQCSAVQSDILV